MKIQEKLYIFLRKTEKYTKTDMVYLFKGSFWFILGKTLSSLTSLIILIIFAHFAEKKIYGTYQYIISLITILGIFCLPGLDAVLIRTIAKGKEKTFFLCEKTKLKWGFLTTLISFFIALWYFFNKNFELSISFLIAGIFLPFITIFNLYSAFWQGKKRFDIQNKYFILQNTLTAITFSLIIFLKPNLIYIIFGYFFSLFLTTFIFYKLTKKKINKNTEEEKESISFGKHLTLMSLPGTISSQIDNVILWQFSGSVAAAIYAYALRIVEKINELIPFYDLALPKMSEMDLKNSDVKKKIFDKFLKLFWLTIPFALIYILVCPIFFKIFFPEYTKSIIYSQALFLLLALSPFSFLATTFLAEMKKRELYILNFVSQFLKIFLFFVLIPFFNIWGGIFSILISQIVYSILTLYFFRKI